MKKREKFCGVIFPFYFLVGFMSILKEIIVHSNSTVIVTVTYLLPASNHVFKQGQWYCRLYDFAQK